MKIIAVINLKGGVAKTITSDNMADILVSVHGKRVLLIDNDKQGNTSKFFGLHGYDKKTIGDVLLDSKCNIRDVIEHTQYKNLDLISANMDLMMANQKLILDSTRIQQIILREKLKVVKDDYDFVIIDNAPDINIGVMNALVAADEVIVPIKIDQFAFDGLEQLTEYFDSIREGLNPQLTFKGCLVTQYANNKTNKDGTEWLASKAEYPLFKTVIHRTVKVDESTFYQMPIMRHSRYCRASLDYQAFVKEYLQK